MPKITTPKLAQRSGRWITKTDAIKTYKLASSDLDSILPITDDPNPRQYGMRMKKYNRKDVEELAQRLRTNSQASESTSTTELAVANGPQIMRTTAMNNFGLKSCQMDRLKPVKVLPNPYKSGQTMRFYNRCDVQVCHVLT
ncbi:hypothetical protein BDZ89DRAFT_308967 [Hymenopellis radicata]|nr:hypothetical protein BDZ89DRAFT_308967 [Hymenopellis radicata]